MEVQDDNTFGDYHFDSNSIYEAIQESEIGFNPFEVEVSLLENPFEISAHLSLDSENTNSELVQELYPKEVEVVKETKMKSKQMEGQIMKWYDQSKTKDSQKL